MTGIDHACKTCGGVNHCDPQYIIPNMVVFCGKCAHAVIVDAAGQLVEIPKAWINDPNPAAQAVWKVLREQQERVCMAMRMWG
jgi:hypothetical protein